MIIRKENSLELEMLESIAQTGVGGIAEDILETAIDKSISDEILKEIPIIKYVVVASKSVLMVRDYLFVNKIIAFLRESGKIDVEKRKCFVDQIKIKEQEKEVGSKLLEIIDKSIGNYKAELLGKLFVVFLEEESLTKENFFRVGEMVASAYESDLRYFLKTKVDDIGETGDEIEHLLALGFYEREKSAFGDRILEKTKIDISLSGKILKKVSK